MTDLERAEALERHADWILERVPDCTLCDPSHLTHVVDALNCAARIRAQLVWDKSRRWATPEEK